MPRTKVVDQTAPTVLPVDTTPEPQPVEPVAPAAEPPASFEDRLVNALVKAISLTREEPKKNAFNRKVGTPWTPKDGSRKIKLRRKVHQHGLPVDEEIVCNEDIALMNQLKPGLYLNGYVKVLRRKDRGLDIDYPIKTASQKIRLATEFGIHGLTNFLQRLVDEGNNPKQYNAEDVGED